MKKLLGVIILIITIPTAFICGVWYGIISPIMTLGEAYDNNTLTATLVGMQVIWFLLRGVIGGIILFTGIFIGTLLIKDR